MSKRRRGVFSGWQQQCLAQFRDSAERVPAILTHVGGVGLDGETRIAYVAIELNTGLLLRAPGGLPVGDREEFIVAIYPDDEQPPTVYVQHARFLGQPHVLSGHFLCLYLDASREWDPAYGINGGPNGLLNRLWRWLTKAARAEYNPDEAMYHAVGGIPQFTRGDQPLPPIVVRELPPHSGRVASAWLTARSEWCLELHPSCPSDQTAEHVPVLFVDRDLQIGAGSHTVGQLIKRLDSAPQDLLAAARNSLFTVRPQPVEESCHRTVFTLTAHLDEPPWSSTRRESQSEAMLTALAASAARKPHGTPQTMVIAVPHPRGGPRHLIVVHFAASFADRLRGITKSRRSKLLDIDPAHIDREAQIKWCYVSDERCEVNRRRDMGRPVENYLGTDVLVIGVGGIGSWIAEFIVRAGAARVTLCDNSTITGGLLVRQNYTDLDVGAPKADRLAERLRAIAPSAVIESTHGLTGEELHAAARTVDIIIDATVNRVITRNLDQSTGDARRTALLAQVATDAASGSLGLAIVQGRQQQYNLTCVDAATGRYVEQDPALEPYRAFWTDPSPGDEFIPTRGCSLPTFHGSAADLAAVAATLTTVIASHLVDGESGTHLTALPYSGIEPAYRYISTRALDLVNSVRPN